MAKDPAVLFYTSDFLTGTLTMLDDEVGKYIRLLCLQHQKGRLTKKDMLYICNSYVENVFNKFKKDDNNLYYNIRLEEETIKRKKYSESRRNNISKRYEATYEPTYVVHMENENENENVIKNNKVFKKPTLEDLENYSKSINYKLNSQNFLDYYDSVDWMIGKKKMKDWKAAVRTWKNRDPKPVRPEYQISDTMRMVMSK